MNAQPHAHFIGLCGAGMSAVAKLLLDAGYTVSGSDEGCYPPISDVIARYGIECNTQYRAENIPKNTDIIIIGKHAKLVPEENEEVAAAFASGKEILSFPQVLQRLTEKTENYVVVGSYGKSTTTALITWTLTHAGKNPSYFLGAAAKNFTDNGHLSTGNQFALEGDEYPAANWDTASKFMYYNAKYCLLTSGEHDHINVFPTIEDYLKPFQALVQTLPADGLLAACRTGKNMEEVTSLSTAPLLWYAAQPVAGATWWAENIERGSQLASFDLMHEGEKACRIETIMLGLHNIENIVGAGALLITTGAVTPEEFGAAMKTFSGVQRRLELLTKPGQVPIYSDFGSSRAKALAGIQTIREQYPEHLLVVCFEPHTFSFRNREALEWYDDLFLKADMVYVFQPPTHGASTHEQLTQDEIVNQICASGIQAEGISSADQLLKQAEWLKTYKQPFVVLFETSGGFDGAMPRMVEALTA